MRGFTQFACFEICKIGKLAAYSSLPLPIEVINPLFLCETRVGFLISKTIFSVHNFFPQKTKNPLQHDCCKRICLTPCEPSNIYFNLSVFLKPFIITLHEPIWIFSPLFREFLEWHIQAILAVLNVLLKVLCVRNI